MNGRVYQYRDVPREVYEEFRRAPSKGRYFRDRIRDVFAPDEVR